LVKVTPRIGIVVPIGIIYLYPRYSLNMEVVERCSTTTNQECSLGKKTFNFTGEPAEVQYTRGGKPYTIRISLVDQPPALPGQSPPSPKLKITEVIGSLTPTVRPVSREFLFVERVYLRIIEPFIPIGPYIPVGP
jgi:hypothetical protein